MNGLLPSLLAVAALLPPLLYLLMMVSIERRAERPAVVVGLFVFGAAGAVLYNQAITQFLASDIFWTGGPLQRATAGVLFQVVIPGEFLRWFVFVAFWQRFIDRQRPMSGVVLGAALGLGFAGVENIGYMILHLEHWQTVAFVRSVVTVPVHGALGAISGVYIARARHRSAADRAVDAAAYVKALLVPMVLHGLYDLPFAYGRLIDYEGSLPILLLRGAGLAVGLGIFAVGGILTYHRAMLEDPDFRLHCLSPYLLQSPWRLYVLGSLLALLGLVVLAAEAVALLTGATLSGGRIAMLGIGLALLAAVGFLHSRARRQSQFLP